MHIQYIYVYTIILSFFLSVFLIRLLGFSSGTFLGLVPFLLLFFLSFWIRIKQQSNGVHWYRLQGRNIYYKVTNTEGSIYRSCSFWFLFLFPLVVYFCVVPCFLCGLCPRVESLFVVVTCATESLSLRTKASVRNLDVLDGYQGRKIDLMWR